MLINTKCEQRGEFTDLVIVGIGGSDLGPRAIYLALQGFKKEVPTFVSRRR